MCFRPSSAALPIKCPECEYMNKPGTTACLKCGATLPSADDASMSPSAPGAPTAPGAPMAPGAPQAPKE